MPVALVAVAAAALVAALPANVEAPGWASLRASVLATPTGKRLEQESLERRQGGGDPNAAATLRLFGNKGEPRVTLFRDDAAWCPYCQRVWLYLEEKRIPYRVATVPLNAYGYKPIWYSKRVDGGKLPAVELDGGLHVESRRIIDLLETTFPEHGPAMVPRAGSADAERAARFEMIERQLVSDWFSLVFYPVEEGEALERACQNLLASLRRVDEALGLTSGPWVLGGEAPTVADVQLITHVERMVSRPRAPLAPRVARAAVGARRRTHHGPRCATRDGCPDCVRIAHRWRQLCIGRRCR